MFSSRFLNCVDFQIYTTLEPKSRKDNEIPRDTHGQIPQTCFFWKNSENAYDLSKFFTPILYSQAQMSTAESLGSRQLNSFAAFLEDKLHTSSETSVVQNPQVKNMANGKRPQKGGKRLDTNTMFEIPKDRYGKYYTPDEAKHGKENKN